MREEGRRGSGERGGETRTREEGRRRQGRRGDEGGREDKEEGRGSDEDIVRGKDKKDARNLSANFFCRAEFQEYGEYEDREEERVTPVRRNDAGGKYSRTWDSREAKVSASSCQHSRYLH